MGGNGLGAALGYETPYPYRTNGVVKINNQILSNVVSVVTSRSFSLALKGDGTLVTWGESWALKRDGTVVGWTSQTSNYYYGQLLPVENLSNVVAIALGPGGYVTQ